MGKAGINQCRLVLGWVIVIGLATVSPAAAQLLEFCGQPYSPAQSSSCGVYFRLLIASEGETVSRRLTPQILVELAGAREGTRSIDFSEPGQSTVCPSSPDSFPKRWVCGVVTDEAGDPVPDAVVVADGFFTRIRRTTRTDANGRYVISGLPKADSYTVSVETPTHGAADRAELLLKPTDIVDLHLLPMSEVDGLVWWLNSHTIQRGTKIVLENLETGRRRTSTTGQWGFFDFPYILPGQYRIIVYPEGFQPYETVVDVLPWMMHGLRIDVPFRTEERITVDNQLDSHVGGSVNVTTFSAKAIDALPLQNGRTLQSLLSLVPGVVFTDSTGTLGQFTAIGERRFANRLTIDGMAADLAIQVGSNGIGEAASGALPAYPTSGGTQTLVPLGAIDEIAVRTSNATSEYARTPGAQTSVITRSGSDRFSGGAFFDARPSGLAASNWFSNAGQAPRRQVHFWNTGASAGGPISARRLFYFGTWEQQNIDRPIRTTIEVPSLAARSAAAGDLRSLLDAYPMPNGGDVGNGLADMTGWFPARSELSVFNVRLDAQAGRHHIFSRVNIGNSHGDALDQLQIPATSYASTEATATRTATVGVMSATPKFAHDLRMNVSTHRGSLVDGPAAFGSAQALQLALLAPAERLGETTYALVNMFPGPGGTLLAGVLGPDTQTQVELLDSISIVRGGHEWRFGVDYRHVEASSDGPQNQVSYRFGSVNDVIQGRVRQVSIQTAAASNAIFKTFSLFAQDTFRPSTRLTIDYGFRYSVEPAPTSGTDTHPLLVRFETLPQLQLLDPKEPLWNTSWTNVAPQVAGSYRLRSGQDWDTKISGAWGLVFDGLTRPGASAFGRGYPYIATNLLPSRTFPVNPSELTASLPESFSSADRSQYYSFPRNLRSPRTFEWHVGLDQAVGQSQRLSLAYVGAAARDLPYWYAYYAGNPMPIINAYSNDGRSDYHALLAEYSRQLSRGISGRVAYTWSHSLDNDSGESLTPSAPPSLIAPSQNRGSADFDRRHVLEAIASYRISAARLPRSLRSMLSDWNLDVVATLRSGAPVSVTTSRIVTTGAYTVRPDVVPGVPVWIADALSSTGQGLNPAAFQNPTETRQGTFGRNALYASPLRQLDLMLTKTVRFRETMNAQFRIQVLNVCNTPNFGPPYATYGQVVDPRFGRPFQTYDESLGSGTLTYGGLVPLQQVGGPRSAQVGIRFGL